jgi:hypothetical protein
MSDGSDRQYIAVTFRPGGKRYHYHNDGPPLMIGDRPAVQGKDGWQRVDVVELVEKPGDLETKGVVLEAGLE